MDRCVSIYIFDDFHSRWKKNERKKNCRGYCIYSSTENWKRVNFLIIDSITPCTQQINSVFPLFIPWRKKKGKWGGHYDFPVKISFIQLHISVNGCKIFFSLSNSHFPLFQVDMDIYICLFSIFLRNTLYSHTFRHTCIHTYTHEQHIYVSYVLCYNIFLSYVREICVSVKMNVLKKNHFTIQGYNSNMLRYSISASEHTEFHSLFPYNIFLKHENLELTRVYVCMCICVWICIYECQFNMSEKKEALWQCMQIVDAWIWFIEYFKYYTTKLSSILEVCVDIYNKIWWR